MTLACLSCGKDSEASKFGFLIHVDTGVNYCGPKRTLPKAWQPTPLELQADAADARDSYDPADDLQEWQR